MSSKAQFKCRLLDLANLRARSEGKVWKWSPCDSSEEKCGSPANWFWIKTKLYFNLMIYWQLEKDVWPAAAEICQLICIHQVAMLNNITSCNIRKGTSKTCAKQRFRPACAFTVWLESSLSSLWIAKEATFFYAMKTDQTAWLSRLVQVYIECKSVHFLMLWLIYQ